ncbi:MAG: pseudouridine synthase [Lentisphaeria bacterium]
MQRNKAGKIRIARFLANAGIASRRQSEKLIENGEIIVNGELLHSPALDIDPEHDVVKYKDNVVKPMPAKYYVLYKPVGYTCSNKDEHAEKLVSELFPTSVPRLFTVGRLDKNSEGLILCTNDGDFAEKIAHPRYQIPKCYKVTVFGKVTEEKLKRLCAGIKEGGENLRALDAAIEELESDTGNCNPVVLRITVAEGKKREIRRMCAACGWRVHRLLRDQIGPLKLGSMKPGQIRELNDKEYRKLMNSAGSGKS